MPKVFLVRVRYGGEWYEDGSFDDINRAIIYAGRHYTEWCIIHIETGKTVAYQSLGSALLQCDWVEIVSSARRFASVPVRQWLVADSEEELEIVIKEQVDWHVDGF